MDGAVVGAGGAIDFDVSYSDNGANSIWIINDALASGTGDDTCFIVNGTIVAREASPTGQGDNWDNFDNHDIANSGDYIFSATPTARPPPTSSWATTASSFSARTTRC